MTSTNDTGGYRIGLPPQHRPARRPAPAGEGAPCEIRRASLLARAAYLGALLSLIAPAVIAGWAYAKASYGAGWGMWLILGGAPALALWRAAQVILDRTTLDAPAPAGILRWLRVPALWLAGSAPLAYALPFLMPPLTRSLAAHGSNGAAGILVAGGIGITMLIAALAPIGLLLFEFTRVRGFEQALRKAKQ